MEEKRCSYLIVDKKTGRRVGVGLALFKDGRIVRSTGVWSPFNDTPLYERDFIESVVKRWHRLGCVIVFVEDDGQAYFEKLQTLMLPAPYLAAVPKKYRKLEVIEDEENK